MLARSLIRVCACAVGLSGGAGCGHRLAPDPFESGAQAGAGGDASGGGTPVGEAGTIAREPALGGPCQSDAQCDDGLPCSLDACDSELGLCRFVPDDSSCADGSYCNGAERCRLRVGCVPGDEVTCDDRTSCTIDRCVEETQSCEHEPRDADADGDPDGNCSGGGDCDDTDPAVSSRAHEICANGRDDDCDLEIDEAECRTPEHDVCADALTLVGSGTFVLDLSAARGDYAASCTASGEIMSDLVLAVEVEDPADVELIARRSAGPLALAAAGLCGDASTELACEAGVTSPADDVVARLLLRSPPPGAIPVYVFGAGHAPVELEVRYLPASTAPENETCGTAAPLPLGVETVASLAGTSPDVSSRCGREQGDLVYSVLLERPQDLRVHATSVSGLSRPMLSLSAGSCASGDDELTCVVGDPANLFARALPAGSYSVAVSADGPGDVALLAELGPPSEPAADESCERAALLSHNENREVSLFEHTDDLSTGCLDGAGDAVFALELEETSDVRLLASYSDGDEPRIALLETPCDADSEPRACAEGTRSPVRLGRQNLAAGSYRVAVESRYANPIVLTALVRPTRPRILVPFADACDDVFEIPPGGALLAGNTANASADYAASCDVAAQPPGGAPDQLLRLVLDQKRRVVLDAGESGYDTVVSVRRGAECPGSELPHACAAGYLAGRSYLDLSLEAGTYWVQVDGFAGDSGPWALDVFVVGP